MYKPILLFKRRCVNPFEELRVDAEELEVSTGEIRNLHLPPNTLTFYLFYGIVPQAQRS